MSIAIQNRKEKLIAAMKDQYQHHDVAPPREGKTPDHDRRFFAGSSNVHQASPRHNSPDGLLFIPFVHPSHHDEEVITMILLHFFSQATRRPNR
jgi:hypothetical protein